MPHEIKPALSSEHWAGPYPVRREDVTMQVKMRSDDTARIYFEQCSAPVDDTDSLHAIAALSLHGQPFGFTWEDVAALRDAFPKRGEPLSPWYDVVRLWDLLDRIAALLPPSTVGT